MSETKIYRMRFSPQETGAAEFALRLAAAQYRLDAAHSAGFPRLVTQFEQQATDAENLATRFANADFESRQ